MPTFLTLPDYLKPGLKLVFVGINPSLYSAQRGQYFARKANRFWPAFNAAGFVPIELMAATGERALDYGIGFTDVVKRATPQAAELTSAEFREGVAQLEVKLQKCRPAFICFNGLTGYKQYLRFTGPKAPVPTLGLQPRRVAGAGVFVIPSTSPANAAVPLASIVAQLRELKALLDETFR